MHALKQPLLLVSLLSLLGCNEAITSDGKAVVCTAQFVYGLQIKVFDQETGYPNACGSDVTIQDGSYLEELNYSPSNDCDEDYVFLAAGERAGNYTITVNKDGYQQWQRDNIELTANVCHVNPITVEVYLEK